jgi:hypothetical protein
MAAKCSSALKTPTAPATPKKPSSCASSTAMKWLEMDYDGEMVSQYEQRTNRHAEVANLKCSRKAKPITAIARREELEAKCAKRQKPKAAQRFL